MTETSTKVGAGLPPGAANGWPPRLTAELQHRSRNLFAIIHALAVRSLNSDSPLEEAREAFIGRLEALARADQRLLSDAWKGTSLNDLVRSELEPFADRIIIEGADVTLNARATLNLALALHELAVNASKCGALSSSGGVVSIGWVVSNDPERRKLRFRWQERGGPPVSPAKRTRFGTFLLRAALDQGRLEYAIEGLTYEADVPLSTIDASEGPTTEKPMAAELYGRKGFAGRDGRQRRKLPNGAAEDCEAQVSFVAARNNRSGAPLEAPTGGGVLIFLPSKIPSRRFPRPPEMPERLDWIPLVGALPCNKEDKSNV